MAYGAYRETRVAAGELSGQTWVVNWPLWTSGGMGQSQEQSRKLYLQSSGQEGLSNEAGLKVFTELLANPSRQRLILVGERGRTEQMVKALEQPIKRQIRGAVLEQRISPSLESKEEQEEALAKVLDKALKEQVSELLKIPASELEDDENLVDYGFDSLSLASFAERLSVLYQLDITPAVFFSHSSLGLLRKHLISSYGAQLQVHYGVMIEDAAQTNQATETSVTQERGPLEGESLVITGMSGRFGKAGDVASLWQLLAKGESSVTELAQRRQILDDGGAKPSSGWRCSVIDAERAFDNGFFDISPREAQWMDPRQRVLLETAWHCLEDAGLVADERHKIGMFIGVEQGDYQLLTRGGGSITANHDGVLASRLAYFLNLSGPVMALNTACSSGLVAMHQGCMALRHGACDTVLVGAVNLMLTEQVQRGMLQAGMLSDSGACRAFSKDADGIVPGEAAVVLAVRRKGEAERSGDRIYAELVGIGVNYDGKTNGITAPSGAAQSALLHQIYDDFGLDIGQLGYVVAHGTGTKLGDSVELTALESVLRARGAGVGQCALTSVKGNLGHTLAASGLVSVVALVEALRHKEIPESLYCAQENDYIHWSKSPLYVNKALKAWESEGLRMGGVSSFGMSGTNAHAVLREYVADTRVKAQVREG